MFIDNFGNIDNNIDNIDKNGNLTSRVKNANFISPAYADQNTFKSFYFDKIYFYQIKTVLKIEKVFVTSILNLQMQYTYYRISLY